MNLPVGLSSERATVVCFPTSEVIPPIHCPELVISVEIRTKQNIYLVNTHTFS